MRELRPEAERERIY